MFKDNADIAILSKQIIQRFRGSRAGHGFKIAKNKDCDGGILGSRHPA